MCLLDDFAPEGFAQGRKDAEATSQKLSWPVNVGHDSQELARLTDPVSRFAGWPIFLFTCQRANWRHSRNGRANEKREFALRTFPQHVFLREESVDSR
jgi:hypothetical protein